MAIPPITKVMGILATFLLNRKFIGIEKEEEYILMAENRLKQTNLDVYGESAEPKFIYDKQIQEVWKNGME